jgi:alanine-glyoxylate transaminase/serine-glyoxylate transaminase/serine-pyruvate transaminase
LEQPVPEPGPLNPPLRLLLGPGPGEVHPRVLRALATPLLGYLDPEFVRVMDETQALLRQVYQTQNPLTFPVSATGMAGMETCFANLVEWGHRVLVCVNGFFGKRMVEVAGRCGAEVIVLERPWGEVFDLNQIREVLQKKRPEVVAIVHAETSTGAWQPLDGLGDLCREHDALLLVDTVTSLGCVPVTLDAWGVDAAYSCSQKGLSCPPGLSPVSFSPRAVEAIGRRKTRVQSWYFDLTLLQRYWCGAERVYHHTAPCSMIYALREGLSVVVEEGLEARFARHRRNAQAFKAGMTALGIGYVAAEGHQLPQVHAVRIPPDVVDLAVRKRLLAEHGIEIGAGLGDFKGQVWRFGLMGHGSRVNNVLLLLAALEACLLAQGANVTPGAAVAAAQQVYAE